MKELHVTDESGRIDKVISEIDQSISRSRAKKLTDEGNVTVNGEVVKPKYKVSSGDTIVIQNEEPREIDLTPEEMSLDIVYEDDDVIVVNKPSGMVVHPAAGHESHTLVNGLLAHSPLSTINGEFRPGIVHRIDKDTSGLLMVAKNDNAHTELSKQLKEKKNLRKYVALVYGVIDEDSGSINAPIGRSKTDRKKQAIVSDGRDAITHFSVIKRFENFTLVECRLETGRTHQIRVHFKYIGHSLVGDPLYGPKKVYGNNGQFLHAQELGFEHPKTGELMIFSSPLPEYFKNQLAKLAPTEI
ncbi:pseudouridine synthase [Lentilactobacillus curieae]|uniref:Pseudouridine synthase n=1 Tax=Lentilactobacillus curieae TaxID=1138822 RepID=A0A1S6QK92_9LACO|nr:RluA family pseudouridine synthase [Lentilactobacillus curieae]AQW22057.1 pseudouridine synthase [Lentilactobacillus curieae]